MQASPGSDPHRSMTAMKDLGARTIPNMKPRYHEAILSPSLLCGFPLESLDSKEKL